MTFTFPNAFLFEILLIEQNISNYFGIFLNIQVYSYTSYQSAVVGQIKISKQLIINYISLFIITIYFFTYLSLQKFQIPPIMKNPGFLLLLTFVLIFTACQPVLEEDKTVILNGKIENPNTELLIFTVSDLPEDLIKDTVYLNEDGTFKTSFELPECRPVTLYDGKESTQMYLCPGDSVFITLNTEEFDESLRYEGNGEKKNNILAEYYLKFKDFGSKDFINFYKIKDTTASIYIELVNTTADETSDYFDQMKEKNELPPEFVSFMETDIYFNRISNLQYLSYSSKKDTTEEYKALINEVGDITLDAVKYENPDYLNQNYQAWLNYYISRQLNREIVEEYEKPDKAVYDSIFYARLQQLLSPFELQLYLLKKLLVWLILIMWMDLK